MGNGRLDSLAKVPVIFCKHCNFSAWVFCFFLFGRGMKHQNFKDRCTGTYGFTLHQYLECGLTRWTSLAHRTRATLAAGSGTVSWWRSGLWWWCGLSTRLEAHVWIYCQRRWDLGLGIFVDFCWWRVGWVWLVVMWLFAIDALKFESFF